MTGFGSLYYTDCVPEQGLQGGAGFQFQAATPGTATKAMGVVQGAALYEPPASWMREQRPVASYPRSLAHVAADGVFATAAGHYVGQEANGNRQGNQFTHAVVTVDAADYGVHRPAQLWDAPWWSGVPASGTELPELPAHPAPGPLDTETVQERLRTAEGGRGMLVALVSAVHHLGDPERRRSIVLVTEDPERAACWLSGATLLLPRQAALAIGFKIFVADPQRGAHDVIALHPEWAGRWRSIERGNGLAVFDLDVGRYSEVEPTGAAEFWVPRFLDDDPYDVVDAIELAGQFTGGVPAAPATDRLVALVANRGHALTGADEVDRVATWLREAPWLREASAEASEAVREPVLEAVLEAGPQAGALRTLVAAADAGRWGRSAARLREGLLIAEIAEITEAPSGLDALHELRRFEELDRKVVTPASAVVRIEDAVGAQPVDRIPALCVLAERHQLTLTELRVPDAKLYEFARWWVGRTEPEVQHGRWPVPGHVLDQVRIALRDALAVPADRGTALAAVRDRWGRVLWRNGIDPADPLDHVLAGYAHAVAEGKERDRVLAAVLDASAMADNGQTAWTALFSPGHPSLDDALRFAKALHARTRQWSPTVIDGLRGTVDRERDRSVTAPLLRLVDEMSAIGLPLPEHGQRIQRDNEILTGIEEGLRRATLRKPAPEVATDLDRAPREILRAHAGALGAALVAGRRRDTFPLVARCAKETIVPILDTLVAALRTTGGHLTDEQCRTAAFLFALTGSDPGSKDRKRDYGVLRGRLGEAIRGVTPSDHGRINRSVVPELGAEWWDWLRDQEPGRTKLLRWMRSGGKPSGREA